MSESPQPGSHSPPVAPAPPPGADGPGAATDEDLSDVGRAQDDEVDDWGKASFPASDPPGWWGGP